MPVERIDHMRALEPRPEPRSMTTALVVGEFLTMKVRVGGVDLLFGLEAKAAVKEALRAAFVDNVKIVLTIGSESGQRARVRVQAPDTVRILKPEKAAG
jgi:hypothetical protein